MGHKGILHGAIALAAALLTACATPIASPPTPEPNETQQQTRILPAAPAAATGPRMPIEVRQGRFESAVQAVEATVSREEVAATINALLQRDQICMRLPGLWLDREELLGVFIVRYDFMVRDWGEAVAGEARQRMNDFVDMGFVTAQGDSVVTYTLTPLGRSLLRGSFDRGGPPSFCGPAERHLVEIIDMEWGAFDCGTLRVHFTHTADSWPSWATAEAAHAHVLENMPAPGVVGHGSVSLSRQWFSRDNRAEAATNGSLRSLCYDPARRSYQAGGDLNIWDQPPDIAEEGPLN